MTSKATRISRGGRRFLLWQVPFFVLFAVMIYLIIADMRGYAARQLEAARQEQLARRSRAAGPVNVGVCGTPALAAVVPAMLIMSMLSADLVFWGFGGLSEEVDPEGADDVEAVREA